MKTLTVLSAMAGVLLLGGCAAMEKEIHDADQQQCEGYGFKSGTDSFAGCMQKIASDRQKRADAVMAAGTAKPAAVKTDCKTREKEKSSTTGTSTSTTTGGIGSSTTTGSSSSTTTSSGFSFTSCVDE